MSLFSIDIEPGRRSWIARSRIAPEPNLLGAWPDDKNGRRELVNWCVARFQEDVRAKIPELERMKVMELYYAGFHWADPIANRENAVRNFCFATVETVHPILTEQRPRPEIVMRRTYGAVDPATGQMVDNSADDLNDYAQWLMDVTRFDLRWHTNSREKLKRGWNVWMLQCDPDGICAAIPFSAWDFYPEAAATHEDEMDHYSFARPVPTEWLRDQYADPEKYPHLFDPVSGESLIESDNIVSPSYDVLERPYMMAHSNVTMRYFDPENIVGAVSRLEAGDPNGPPSSQTTSLVRIDSGERRQHGRTTFLITFVVRDHSTMRVTYSGDEATRGDDESPWDHTPSMRTYQRNEPCTPSGWKVINFTASGRYLDCHALDPCYCGRNIEIGRDYAQMGRFYGIGELDAIIPINRSMNRRLTVLGRALEFEAVPILLLDEGAGGNVDQRAFEPGDTIRKQRGSDVRWLDFPSIAAEQFELYNTEKADLDIVSGVHDVTEGRRPEGIEAAAAIRSLQDAAQTRIRGKEIPAFDEMSRLLKKMMVATAKKAKAPIWFKARNGQMKALDPEVVLREYDIRFAPGSGTAIGRQMQEDKIMALVQGGMIDNQSALERLNIKGVDEILSRQAQQAAQAAQAARANPAPAAK